MSDALRAKYLEIRRWRLNGAFSSGRLGATTPTLTPRDFDAAVASWVGHRSLTPEEWVQAAADLPLFCGRCGGTGEFITAVVNGKPTGPGGECFQCNGKGVTTYADDRRNVAYWTKYARP